jgi:hypothetical protein
MLQLLLVRSALQLHELESKWLHTITQLLLQDLSLCVLADH